MGSWWEGLGLRWEGGFVLEMGDRGCLGKREGLGEREEREVGVWWRDGVCSESY